MQLESGAEGFDVCHLAREGLCWTFRMEAGVGTLARCRLVQMKSSVTNSVAIPSRVKGRKLQIRAEASTSSSSSSSIIQEARVTLGEELPRSSAIHSVTVIDRQKGVTHKFDVPEDQYILHTGEDQGKDLPFSCRHGCCTACAVRVKSGNLYQPEALGISAELKEQGYALLCVGYALSDLEVETQDEDEVYWLQFGRYFARGPVERDDYAIELAMADE
ncbi:hypothetical protein R1flu_012825 [Riccia fluitans]|uniref:Ferredoxin n=1 Tax=Riccia fluitans TaxID=41844 RepID=A0ABD1ZBP9_9MARC